MGLDLNECLITLPSEGIPYKNNEKLKLINDNQVKIRRFKVGDQKDFSIAVKASSTYKIYERLLQKLVVEPVNIPVGDLLMSDALAILFAVKVYTYSNLIDLNFQCQFCETHNSNTYDMNEMKNVKASSVKDYSPNDIRVTLSTGQLVSLHLPRLRDELISQDELEEMIKRNELTDYSVERSYMRKAVCINSIDGESLSPASRYEAIMDMEVGDYDLIKEALVNGDTGLDWTRAKSTCVKCSEVNEVPVVLNEEFFRPASNKRQPA